MKHFLREYAARSILPHLKTAARSMNNQNYKNNIYFNDAINTTIGGNFNEDWEVEGEKETEEDLLFGRIYDKSSKINPTEMANGGMANTNSNLYYIQPQQQLLADILSSSNSENAIFNGQHDVDVVSRFEDYTEYLNLNDSNNTSSPAPALILTSSLSSLPALHLLASLASVTTTTISSITHQIKQQTEETFQDYISIRFLNNHTYNSFSCDGESQTLSALNSSFADGDDVGGGGATEANESALSSVYFKTIVYLLYIPIFVFALLGNGTVCYIVQSTPRMRTVTNYFIANLAVGDILMSLFCVPSSFISIFILGYWPFGIVLCHLVNYSQAVSVLVSAYTLVAISIDRYIAIMWPLRPRITKRYAKFIIAGIWIIALATAFPIPIVSKLVQPGAWHVFCERYVCQEEWLSKEQNYYYTWALLTLQFLVPLSVLIFTYTRIALAVWGKRPPGEAENSRDQRMARSKRKVSSYTIK